MPETVTVEEWKRHGSSLETDASHRGYAIGNENHGAQITVYGSEDLTDQVLELLNKEQITFVYDEKNRKENSDALETL